MSRSNTLMLLFCLIASTAQASQYSLTDYGITSSEIYLNSSGQVQFSPNYSFVPDHGPWQFGYHGDPTTVEIFDPQPPGYSSEISSNALRGNTPTGPITGEITALFSNSSGIIVGTVDVSHIPQLSQAWVENVNSFNAGPNLIPIPSGFIRLQPSDINSSGLIVGSAFLTNGSTRAFLYDGNTTVDLNTLIPPGSGLTLTSAVQFGDLGQIVGYAVDGSGKTHAVLLTPTATPEPSSLLIALGSVVAFPLILRARKPLGSHRSTLEQDS